MTPETQTGKNAGKNVIDIAGIFCCRVTMAQANKTGRKRKDFTDPATGLPVIGLSRMTDGRWRIIGTQTRFSEPDPQTAIEQYRKLAEGESEASVYQRIWGRQQLPMTMDQWWAYVAKEIRLRPQWVAKKTGDTRAKSPRRCRPISLSEFVDSLGSREVEGLRPMSWRKSSMP